MAVLPVREVSNISTSNKSKIVNQLTDSQQLKKIHYRPCIATLDFAQLIKTQFF